MSQCQWEGASRCVSTMCARRGSTSRAFARDVCAVCAVHLAFGFVPRTFASGTQCASRVVAHLVAMRCRFLDWVMRWLRRCQFVWRCPVATHRPRRAQGCHRAMPNGLRASDVRCLCVFWCIASVCLGEASRACDPRGSRVRGVAFGGWCLILWRRPLYNCQVFSGCLLECVALTSTVVFV